MPPHTLAGDSAIQDCDSRRGCCCTSRSNSCHAWNTPHLLQVLDNERECSVPDSEVIQCSDSGVNAAPVHGHFQAGSPPEAILAWTAISHHHPSHTRCVPSLPTTRSNTFTVAVRAHDWNRPTHTPNSRRHRDLPLHGDAGLLSNDAEKMGHSDRGVQSASDRKGRSEHSEEEPTSTCSKTRRDGAPPHGEDRQR